MTESYTLKQIIFALRKEYLEVEKQLNDLKKYATANDSINDFQFRLTHFSSNTCRMILDLKKKKNLLDKIKKILGTYPYGLYCDVTTKVEKSYYIGYRGILTISNLEELRKAINEIMQTDFVQNIVANNGSAIPCNENKYNKLFIITGGIDFRTSMKPSYDDDLPWSWFYYYSHRDEIVVKNGKKIITPEDIYESFDLSFSSSYLNNYHRKFLDNYEEKEVDIDGIFNSTKVNLEIIEEPKKLILRQKHDIRK